MSGDWGGSGGVRARVIEDGGAGEGISAARDEVGLEGGRSGRM